GPTIQKNSPTLMSRSMPLSASIGRPLTANRFAIPRRRTFVALSVPGWRLPTSARVIVVSAENSPVHRFPEVVAGVTVRSEYCILLIARRRTAEEGVDVFSDDFAVGRYREQATGQSLVDERVAIPEPLSIGVNGTE